MPAPILLPYSADAAAGVTRQQYRRALQAEIGHYRLVAATSNASEPRLLTLAALEGETLPMSRFDGHYAYAPSLDEAHRVISGSFYGGDGSLALDGEFSLPLSSADLEITNTLPGTYYLDIRGANQIVDEALSKLLVWARIDLTGDGTRSFSLGAYPWLTHEDMLSHIEDRWGSADETLPTMRSPYGLSVQQDGAGLTLVTDLAYAEDEAFTVVAIRPGDAWIRSGGTWGAGSGLNSESDAAAAPLRWVRIWGAVCAYRHLIEVTEEDESIEEKRRARRVARYERRIKTYQPVMAQIILHELPRPRVANARPLVGGLMGGDGLFPEVAGTRPWWD